MISGNSQSNEILFRLRLTNDPESAKTLKDFSEQAKRAQRGVDEASTQSTKKAADNQTKQWEEVSRNRIKMLARISDFERKKQIEAERAQAKTAREAEKIQKEQERAARAAAKAQEKAAKEAERAAEQQRKQQEQIARNRIAMVARVAEHERQKRIQTEREEQQLAARVEQAHNQIRSARGQMIEGFTSATESVARFGRGLAMIGLVGEENTRKLLDGLIKIQAAFDLTVGAVNTYHRLSKAVDAYRTSVQAATVAETALATARARSAAAGVANVGTTGLVGVGTTGAGGTVLAGTLTKLGGAAAAATAALASLPATVALIVTGIVTGGAQIGATFVRGRAFGADTLADSGNFDPGAIGAKLLHTSPTTSFFVSGLGREALEGKEKIDKKTAAFIQHREQLRLFGQQRQIVAARDADIRGAELATIREDLALSPRQFTLRREGKGLKADRELNTATEQIITGRLAEAHARKELAEREDARLARTPENAERIQAAQQARLAAVKEIHALEEQLNQTNIERLHIEEQISQERMRSNEQAIQTARDEISLRNEMILQEQNRLQSAKERFGAMDPLQQKQAIEAFEKARRGEDLTRRQIDILGSIDTEQARDFVSRQRERLAEKGMGDRGTFENFFGQYEQEQIKARERERRHFEISLDDAVNYQLELKLEADKVAEPLIRAIRAMLPRELEKTTEKITERAEQAVQDVTAEFERRFQNIEAGFANRG